MVDLADLRRWDPAALNAVYDDVASAEQELMQIGDDFIAAGKTLRSWTGPAAELARQEHQALMSALSHGIAGLRLLMKTLGELMDAVPAMQRAITEAEEHARKFGYHVGENGDITDVLNAPGPHDPHPDDRKAARTEVEATLKQVVRTGTDIDADLTRVLERIGDGEVGTGGETTTTAAAAHGASAQALTLPDPPQNATAAQNAAWWSTLSPNAQKLMVGNRPALLGNRDGIPGEVRSAANLTRLSAEQSRLQQQLKDLQRRRREAHPPGTDNRTTIGTDAVLAQEFESIQAKLDELYKVETTMNRGNRQLLTFDPSGERLKAAVAIGNVDTAKHVAVFTPGFNTTVGGDLPDYDTNMERLRETAQRIQDVRGGEGDVAAVTWMGYEAPQPCEIPDVTGDSVLFGHAAEEGGEKLAGFVNGIEAARPDNSPHLTALGHSYGSTTTGHALRHDTPVDDAVLFGSPGVGASDPGDLQVDDGRMYTAAARGDDVPYAAVGGTLGESPYMHPDHFQPMGTGASTGEFGPLQESYGHSEYLKDRTTSQYNMAAVVTGHQP